MDRGSASSYAVQLTHVCFSYHPLTFAVNVQRSSAIIFSSLPFIFAFLHYGYNPTTACTFHGLVGIQNASLYQYDNKHF